MTKIKKFATILLAGVMVGFCFVILLSKPSKEEIAQAQYRTAQQEQEYALGLYTDKKQEYESAKVKYESVSKEVEALEALLKALGVGVEARLEKSALNAVIESYGSTLDAGEYIEACSKYPAEMCKIFVGIMAHESKLCTHFYLPAIETNYFNCSGWKSKEILETHSPDKNGSWLKRFDSYKSYYEEVLPKFYAFYWQQNLRTAEDIVNKYVGHYSKDWVGTVNLIVTKL